MTEPDLALTTESPDPAPSRPPDLTGLRLAFDYAYAVIAVLFLVAVLAQVYLAGYGAFAHHDGADVVHHAFRPHENLGNYLGLAAAVLFVLSLVARAGGRVVVGALVLVLLTEVAQHGLAEAGKEHRWVGGLHAFDGMLILGLATWAAVAAYRRRIARAAH